MQVTLTPDEVSTLASAGQCDESAIEDIESRVTQDEIDILKLIAARIKALGG